jgi:hypothetical protein
MPVSLPHALTPADFMAEPATGRRSAVDRISDWLKVAQQRRAERIAADYICMRDFNARLD